ncbi:MAG: sulfatase-like hydrolase/transferase, partial [Acidobacteria bacterium]|nr:sulfatase-like hydrolase/transferase [Acidobacteriota bacterium]
MWPPDHMVCVPRVEAISTANVTTGSFDAEQGMAGGAVVAVATKSGANEFRGSAFEYHDNQRLRTRNFFLPADRAKAKSIFSLSQPNVILILTDDQGYGDLSCHGNPVLKTPNLDKLHAESIRFTDFHVAPMCTPTRGQLMTGVDALRNGAMHTSSARTLLRQEFSTMPEIFAANGYRTALFGKWHLGDNYPYRPQDRGFQETIWFP